VRGSNPPIKAEVSRTNTFMRLISTCFTVHSQHMKDVQLAIYRY
jgi:hypothetical protein